jgi:DNA-binding HxlR family transcriptional regulator
MQIICELWEGNTRFNEIRRALPALSPGLLSRRLKELEAAGMIERVENRSEGTVDYFRTQKAIELEPILDGMAKWAQRHVDAEIALEDKHAGALMWKMQRRIKPEEMLKGRNVLRFHFPDAVGSKNTFWVVAEKGRGVELCSHNPRLDPNLFIESNVGVLTGVYLGRRRLSQEIEDGRIFLSGDTRLVRSFQKWLPQSPYADVEGIATV